MLAKCNNFDSPVDYMTLLSALFRQLLLMRARQNNQVFAHHLQECNKSILPSFIQSYFKTGFSSRVVFLHAKRVRLTLLFLCMSITLHQ